MENIIISVSHEMLHMLPNTNNVIFFEINMMHNNYDKNHYFILHCFSHDNKYIKQIQTILAKNKIITIWKISFGISKQKK